MSQPDIRGFIFDMDGVVADTTDLHFQSWVRLGQEEGITLSPEDNDRMRGLSRRDSLLRFLKDRQLDEATSQDWMARKNRYYLESVALMTPDDVLPGVRELIDDIRAAGMKLAVGSASRNTRAVLEAVQLIDSFDAIGDAHCIVNSKPAPDIFLWAAGAIGLSPRQLVVIEDATSGVDAALAGGFYAVGIGSAGVEHAHLHLSSLADVGLADLLCRLQDALTVAPA